MRRHGIGILHTKEFHDTKGQFGGWTRIRKRSFVDEVFSASHGALMGFSYTVKKSSFLDAKKHGSITPGMSALGLCFSVIMTRLAIDNPMKESIQREGIEFLVEDGNKNNAEIGKFFEQMSRQAMFEGILRAIHFVQKSHSRAIQIADFLAFYSRRHMRDEARFDGQLVLPSCPYLNTVRSHGPVWMTGSNIASTSHIARLQDVSSLAALEAVTVDARRR